MVNESKFMGLSSLPSVPSFFNPRVLFLTQGRRCAWMIKISQSTLLAFHPPLMRSSESEGCNIVQAFRRWYTAVPVHSSIRLQSIYKTIPPAVRMNELWLQMLPDLIVSFGGTSEEHGPPLHSISHTILRGGGWVPCFNIWIFKLLIKELNLSIIYILFFKKNGLQWSSVHDSLPPSDVQRPNNIISCAPVNSR